MKEYEFIGIRKYSIIIRAENEADAIKKAKSMKDTWINADFCEEIGFEYLEDDFEEIK